MSGHAEESGKPEGSRPRYVHELHSGWRRVMTWRAVYSEAQFEPVEHLLALHYENGMVS